MASTHEYKDLADDVKKVHWSEIKIGTITSIDHGTEVAVVAVTDYGEQIDVPVFYHCPEEANTDNGHVAFDDGDSVVVLVEKDDKDAAPDFTIIGFENEIKPCEYTPLLVVRLGVANLTHDSRMYIVWNMETHAYAELIPPGGPPALTFPCTHAEIAWFLGTHSEITSLPCVDQVSGGSYGFDFTLDAPPGLPAWPYDAGNPWPYTTVQHDCGGPPPPTTFGENIYDDVELSDEDNYPYTVPYGSEIANYEAFRTRYLTVGGFSPRDYEALYQSKVVPSIAHVATYGPGSTTWRVLTQQGFGDDIYLSTKLREIYGTEYNDSFSVSYDSCGDCTGFWCHITCPNLPFHLIHQVARSCIDTRELTYATPIGVHNVFDRLGNAIRIVDEYSGYSGCMWNNWDSNEGPADFDLDDYVMPYEDTTGFVGREMFQVYPMFIRTKKTEAIQPNKYFWDCLCLASVNKFTDQATLHDPTGESRDTDLEDAIVELFEEVKVLQGLVNDNEPNPPADKPGAQEAFVDDMFVGLYRQTITV